MNKKGFSLTELLVVIAVLALLAGLAFMAFDGIRDNVLNKQYENILEYARTGAEEYAMKYETQGISYVTIDQLIKDGIILADDESGKIKNPKNGKDMNCAIFKITKTNNNYDVDVYDENNENCDSTMGNEGLSIYCNYLKCKNGWYKAPSSNLTLRLYDNNKRQYISGDILWYSDSGKQANGNSFVLEKQDLQESINQVFFASYNNKTVSQRIKIDKKPPTIVYTIDGDSPDKEQIKYYKKTIDISKSFDNESGIKAAIILDEGQKDCPYNFGYDNYTTVDNKKEITEAGSYTVCIKDNAGNITKDENGKPPTIVAKKDWFFDPIPSPLIIASDSVQPGLMHNLNTNYSLSFQVKDYNSSKIFYKYSIIDWYYYKYELYNSSDMKDKTLVYPKENDANHESKESISIDANTYNKVCLVQACNVKFENHCSAVSAYIINPDNNKPTIGEPVVSSTNPKKVTITIEDKEYDQYSTNNKYPYSLHRISGLKDYAYLIGDGKTYSQASFQMVKENGIPGDQKRINSFTFEINITDSDLNNRGEAIIYVWARDNAGNISETYRKVVTFG